MTITKLMIATTMTLAAAVWTGCSDDPTGSNDATVTMQAELEATGVNRTLGKQGASTLSGAEVDSLHVARVRVLISELKLHRDKEDDVAGDKNIKVGPMLVSVTAAGTKTFATGTIPGGSYDKLKFEFHRFSSSEVSRYLADTLFADFVTDDRYTVIIDGTVFKNGQSFPFTYRSDVTANLTYKFEPALTLEPGTNVVLVVSIDPIAVFKKGGAVLDPRDGSNENEIDNAIKTAIKALKR